MNIQFKEATIDDCEVIAAMVLELTHEISMLTKTQHFALKLNDTIEHCSALISEGHYAAIIALCDEQPIAIATLTETYALYVGGKIGVIQEFYVTPSFRASGTGTRLLEQVKSYGRKHCWASIELCTPPLPEFERSLNFYQKNGLMPVGGRKMRQNFC